MILYPAIDIKDGACVRTIRGDMEDVAIYNFSPVEQALQFEKDGFPWLHIVDLNGAASGEVVNGQIVKDIMKSVKIPIQLGGGIREMEQIDYWIDAGVTRVILGTAALRDPDLVLKACQKYPGKISVSIDAREGYVAIAGWQEHSTIKVLDLALKYEDAGVATIIYTDINRDGAMSGMNIEAIIDLAFALTTPVIASGGLAGIEDLEELVAQKQSGIQGVIIGRALYDGRIDPQEALKLCVSA